MARPRKDGTHVNLYLDRETMEKAEEMAKAEGITKTLLIEMALRDWMKKQERKNKTRDSKKQRTE